MIVFLLTLMLSPTEGVPLFQFGTLEQCELVKTQVLEVNRDNVMCIPTKVMKS